jgi:asparagine synthase (glutamine-hydrolysing)
VKVVLTGEGSDELLAGYGKYPRSILNWRAGALYARLPAPVRKALGAALVPHLPGRLGRYARRSFLAMAHSPEAVFYDNFAAIRLAQQRTLLAPAFAQGATPDAAYGPSVALLEAPNGRSTLLDRLLYADIKSYLVELLMKQDQMSMAASIESRVPFLDHRLVEFAATLPGWCKLRGFTTKRVLREAMKGVLPPEILARPKMGFPVPFGRWVRGGWHAPIADVLLDPGARRRGLFDTAAVERLIADHRGGRADGGDALWSLLNLELWYRTFIDGGGVQEIPKVRPKPDLARQHDVPSGPDRTSDAA